MGGTKLQKSEYSVRVSSLQLFGSVPGRKGGDEWAWQEMPQLGHENWSDQTGSLFRSHKPGHFNTKSGFEILTLAPKKQLLGD